MAKTQDYKYTAALKSLVVTGKRIHGLYQENFIDEVASLSVWQADQVALDFSRFARVKHATLLCKREHQLPDSLSQLRSLESLTTNCRLPSTIERFEKLRTLRLDRVAEIPRALSQLGLRELIYIYYDKAFEPIACPEVIYELSSLEALEFCLCRLHSIEDRLGSLVQLRSLSFGSSLSDLRRFPDLSGLRQLERLAASGQSVQGQRKPPYALLSSVLDNVRVLPGLRELDLSFWAPKRKDEWLVSDGKRHSIPDCFGHLERLEKLSIYGMKLDFLPASLFQLRSLRELNVGHNHLNDDELKALRAALPRLELVNADRNQPRPKRSM